MSQIIILGSGISSLASAALLAKEGHQVQVFEKNEQAGGRARSFSEKGFRFDMGPSWFWMPDVFERFYKIFGKDLWKELDLTRLDPSYKVFFEGQSHDIPAGKEAFADWMETIESGASKNFLRFIRDAEENYNIAVKDMIYQPGKSPLELVNWKTFQRLGLFIKSIEQQINGQFTSPKLRQILSFPVLFLGASPDKTPAFYNFMNHADTNLGTWYPKGGFFALIQSMLQLCLDLGVTFTYNSPVEKIICENNEVTGVQIKGQKVPADIVLSGADYCHTEQLLDAKYRQYSDQYWAKRQFAPSSLIFYLGIDRKVPSLEHHNLFFDTDFKAHSDSIYLHKKWPNKPLFYVCAPSKTDDDVAPKNMENIFVLIPIAAGLKDIATLREDYLQKILARLEEHCNIPIKDHIVYQRSYCLNDFIADYNACQGNAYGLANTLTQTAFLRPSLQSKKLKNLFFCGQLSVPGPGVPPALISGEISANLINQYAKSHEITI